MRPGAQIAAAIDLVTIVEDGWSRSSRAPADQLLQNYFKERRYIGAKDRGAISSLVYGVLRQGAMLEWQLERVRLPAPPRLLVLAALLLERRLPVEEIAAQLTGEGYDAPRLTEEEAAGLGAMAGADPRDPAMPLAVRGNIPEWMEAPLSAEYGDEFVPLLDALAEEAPVDLRVNTLKATRSRVSETLAEAGFAPIPISGVPNGLRLTRRGALFATQAFRDGWFEMQDEGSQRLVQLTQAKAGQKIVDFCAGAGGKTLALAAQMGGRGRILAWDTSEKRLSQMPKRLARAGVGNVTLRLIASESDPFVKRHKRSADAVLVDAPCTGSGTWRRNPDLKWRTSPNDLAELCDLQGRILASAARLVKPGGLLVYATCSLFEEENAAQKTRFLDRHRQYGLARELRLLPHRDGCDGFYAAVFRHQTDIVQDADGES